MVNSKKLSISKIKKLLTLFKFIVSQRSDNKTTVLSFLDEKSINDISESIYNILYNEKLNLNLSKTRKAKLKKIIKPNSRIFEDISKRNIPVKRRHTKIIQQGTGIGTILLTLIPVLTSLLTKRK
jgi:hypothetical protein